MGGSLTMTTQQLKKQALDYIMRVYPELVKRLEVDLIKVGLDELTRKFGGEAIKDVLGYMLECDDMIQDDSEVMYNLEQDLLGHYEGFPYTANWRVHYVEV